MKTKDLKKRLLKKAKKEVITDDMLLHTGSTLLNCGLTNKPFGGFIKGRYFHIVGDSASGKTFLSLTCLAEACLNENFEDYDLIHDDVEGGNLMNIHKLFPVLADRLQTVRSYFLEEMYYRIHDQLESGKPFIYVVDSMDGLTPKADVEKFKKQKNAFMKGREVAGSYGAAAAKINSQNLRQLMTPLMNTGSILLLISQSRDNLNAMFDTKTNAGGKSVKFYATAQIWSSIKGKLKKSVKGKDRPVGITAKIQIKKNRATGKDRTIEIPIFNAFKGSGGGFDDIGACIDYLIEEKHWKKKGQSINAEEFGFSGTRDKLIARIEKKLRVRYPKLQRIVGEVWNSIEEECSVERKNRYEI